LKDSVIKKKICLLGSFGVGKTSLVQRFVYNRFEESYLSTIGVRVAQKEMRPESAQAPMRMLIWDIEGYESGKALNTNYYMGAAGGILVGDVTRPDTFSELVRLFKRFKTISPEAIVVMAANKIDLVDDADTVEKTLQPLYEEIVGKLYLTSAKSGANVQEIFFYLYEKLSVNSKG